ncbi:MAG: PDZ domain-containing protein [Spirochaetota bacterium]
MRLIAALFVALSLAGCATAPEPGIPSAQQGSEVSWPKIYADETYLFDFSSSLSEAEAVGTIKNLQDSMVEYNANLPFSFLDVDAFGFRARWSWAEGTMVKSAGFIIPYDQVSSILLQHYPATDKNFKWGVNVYMKGPSTVSLRTPTRDAAQRLGRAIHALAKARGAALSAANPRFGAALSTLSDAQAKAAGLAPPGGLIISWIFLESPAQRAGFSPQDIILSVAGAKVTKTEQLIAILEFLVAEGTKEAKIEGLRRSYRVEGDKYIEIFVPVTFTLSLDHPAGGSR